MLRSNLTMRAKLPKNGHASKPISQPLIKLFANGFTVVDECVFLQSLLSLNQNATLHDFPDKTGFECYVNSIHIDDYAEDGDLEQTVFFLFELFKLWNKEFKNKILRAIISSDEFGTVLRFHVLRDDESWIAENLEEYEEAVLVADSTDVSSLYDATNTPLIGRAR